MVKKRFFRLYKGKDEMVCKEPLTECFFVEPKMVLLWHRLKNLLRHLYFEEYKKNCSVQIYRSAVIMKKNLKHTLF